MHQTFYHYNRTFPLIDSLGSGSGSDDTIVVWIYMPMSSDREEEELIPKSQSPSPKLNLLSPQMTTRHSMSRW